MPTADELLSQERPFLRTADYIEDDQLTDSRQAVHKDNQFRLLREDMLGEIREELQKLMGSKPGRHKGTIVEGLRLVGIEMGEHRKRLLWGIKLECKKELPLLGNISAEKMKVYLRDNKHILRHGNMSCLLLDNEPVAFPTIHRDEDEISKTPATIVLQLQNDATLPYVLTKIKITQNIKLVQLDAAVFAFEPFLRRLQGMNEIPLSKELLHWSAGSPVEAPPFQPTDVIENLKRSAGNNLQSLLGTAKSVILDDSQMRSLCVSLSQRVSLVQGPPGTGKSFIGALIAKVLHDYTSQIILVVCFTNHALDQFLEDLMEIGIPSSSMIRVGGKCTDRTKPLTIREQAASKLTPSQWDQINKLELRIIGHETRLREAFRRYQVLAPQKQLLMDYLELASDDLPFYEAFIVPTSSTDGMTVAGRKNKAMDPFYLLDRWCRGSTDSGALHHIQPRGAAAIWKMTPEMRQSTQARWQSAILDDIVQEVSRIGQQFNQDQREVDRIRSQSDANIIRSKRIIACTTNSAAKYAEAIQSASPGVVLVEEAGKILESHIITAMGPQTEQLILIGDHQQLRPKCSYELSVDGGNGYDLNRSLFERLVLKGVPHVTLTKQHRMRPEISSLIRHLTYPDLTDADSTLTRSKLRGFSANVMFIHHSEPEIEQKQFQELRDHGAISSKQNHFEAQMILKCVRYLAQQGYGSDKLVVLTPYLGQLKLLRECLSKENDPILNYLDKFDLIRAGLLTDLSAKTSKPSLKISTIDNYQGEESEIVLVSLTRSNKNHDIGFLAAPERLNVLLSRARGGLIMIGNSDTFLNARKGREVWRKFLDHLKENDQIYEGFPIHCEKHPARTAVIRRPEEFEIHAPDGGCKEPCGVLLKCGLHKCPSSCHQIFAHSKMKCVAVMTKQCENGHTLSWHCHTNAPATCAECERRRKEAERKARKAFEKQQRADLEAQNHREELAKIQDQIDGVFQAMNDTRLGEERRNVLARKKEDLDTIRATASKAKTTSLQRSSPRETAAQASISDNTAERSSASRAPKATDRIAKLQEYLEICLDHNNSPSQTEWQRQKDQENASNPSIDAIMDMIGLEDVKSQVLKIKAKVETSIRQGTDLKKERLGLVLLGNPGTGKTTVARHYAKILTSLQVLAGDGFVETTGSRLAHGGVNEVKAHLKTLEESEGGVYFIDEAYQLAAGHNYGGKTVLDYLLAEIENLTGKVIFVFAGYRKEMEKFFEHNPGFPSRIPYILHFEDYTDAELLKMLQYNMNAYYQSTMDMECGPGGLYMRIAVGRLGRGRGQKGFGNARALETLFLRIRERQSDRLMQQRRAGLAPDDYAMTKEDLIGPDPSKTILKCAAWDQLQKLTGLKSVKDSVRFLIEGVKTNYERELQEKKLIEVPLNWMFLGSPGTGKTSVAKLYGRILADIGLLSNGEVVTKNPADFIGSVIGQSEANTKAILETTVGKVLIIDEAYMLSSSRSDGSPNPGDLYKTAVIDTIVADVQSTPGEDRCVLLLGYKDQMTEMFQNVNPGLTRRFQLSDAFQFEDFNDEELLEILKLKLKNQDLGATDKAMSVAIDVLARARNSQNFGNGGDVENLISKAKANFQSRQSFLPVSKRSIDFLFEPQDFDLDYDRATRAETNIQEVFKDVIGCESIIDKLGGYVKVVVQGMRAQGLEPRGQIPMNFIFKGPPGTGKTTTARKFSQVYYDIGFLSKVEVVECSATDLIGQYVGHTGPKTIKQLERGLGKVLFVDEAYRLSEGHFAQEAVNEIVDSMTKPKFAGKILIILAGYDNDMNNLLKSNEGLSSRFADEIIFPSLSPKHCLHLLESKLKESRIKFSALRDSGCYNQLLSPMSKLCSLSSWGNARDVHTIAKRMVNIVFQATFTKTDQLEMPHDKALQCIEDMWSEKLKRENSTFKAKRPFEGSVQSMEPTPISAHSTSFSTSTKTPAAAPQDPEQALPDAMQLEIPDQSRDAGVSDAIWMQVQKDKQEAETQEQNIYKALCDKADAFRKAEELKRKLEAETAALHEIEAKNRADEEELGRRREEARIRELEAKSERERIQRELERQQQVEMERRRKEQLAQAKLQEMGVCPVGFRWIKQSGGYRCAGGSHWVSDAVLGM